MHRLVALAVLCAVLFSAAVGLADVASDAAAASARGDALLLVADRAGAAQAYGEALDLQPGSFLGPYQRAPVRPSLV